MMVTQAMMESAAQKIAASALEATGTALMAGDFDRFAPEFTLPHQLTTPEGTRRLDNLEDMRKTFDSAVAYFRKLQVIDMRRKVETAFFDSTSRLSYSYTTQLFFADQTADAPYFCHARMRRQADRWQMSEIQFALGTRKAQSDALLQPDDGARAPDRQAQEILQDVLNDMTDAFLLSDHRRFAGRVTYPFFLQGDQGSRIYKKEEALLHDLQQYQTELLVHGVTDIVRTVKWAEMIGDQRLQGVYRTHVLSGTNMVIEPYTSAITLEICEDGLWRCTSVLHPVGHLTDMAFRTGGPRPQ